MRRLMILALLPLTACTTVRNPETGFTMPWIAKIPFDKERAGVPTSARSGVRVYTGTVNGRGYSVVVPH